MNQPTDPYLPEPTQPPAPRKRARLLLIIGAAVALLLLIIGGTVAFTLAAVGKDNIAAKPAAQSAWDREQQKRAAEEPAIEALPDPTEPAPVITPAVSDFTLKPKITDKQCFGSAGCNVEFKVDLTYGGSPLDSATTWLVTYEVTGIEDGPMIGSLELTGDTFTGDTEVVSMKSSKSKMTMKVTEVAKVGI
jgi:hypothetical protein